ncbi:hypothetical protein JCM14076_11390 [Methylosoma difficile]
MHFRIRKNVIQLIRVTYDKSKKKGSNAIIGTVPLAETTLSEDLQKLLSQDEIAAYESWVRKHNRLDILRAEFAALTLAENLATAEKWFEREGNSNPIAKTTATEIVQQWHSMRKIFVKMGLLD